MATDCWTASKHTHNEIYRDRIADIRALRPDASFDAVIERLGHGIAAHESVPTALYAFLQHPDSFTDAITYAVSLGGDTDTIASMTGALAGAWLGGDSIPQDWRQRLEDEAYLCQLADELT